MGRMVTGEAEPYQYLVESIRKFPKPQVFAAMIEEAGFRRATLYADDRRGRGAPFGLEAVSSAALASL